MSTDIEFTGERFLPEVSGQIAFEHLHRYYFAMKLVNGCRVLDVACGEGYGSWILSKAALEVIGVDIAPDAVEHAQKKYVDPRIKFVEASAADLPFDDGTFDAVVSFETIEHHDLHQEMLSEIKRVLKKEGVLIISSPNKQYYSIETGYKNPFHVKELYREEFLKLIKTYFANALLFGQRVVYGSLMIVEDEEKVGDFESMFLSGEEFISARGSYKPLYDLLIATDAALPKVGNTAFETEVHGLEPARFYGVHLPDRVSTADAKILELQELLKERGLPANEARELFHLLFDRIDTLRSEEKIITDRLANSMKKLAGDLTSNNAKIEEISGALVGVRASLDNSLHVISEKDANLEACRQDLEACTQKLRSAEQAIVVMRHSWSWRLTSPLRRLKVIWSRGGHQK